MIALFEGDIFNCDAEALVIPCNCVGIMGAGLAKEFRERYPLVHEQYVTDCGKHIPAPGCVHVMRETKRHPYSFLAYTKKHWKDPSQIEWVYDCISNIRSLAVNMGLKKVAVPALGCGLGGLEWEDVLHEMDAVFGSACEEGETDTLFLVIPPKE